MICDKCGCEKLSVIKVFRNRERRNGKWVHNGRRDTRIVVCQLCGSIYKVTSILDAKIVMKNHKRYEESLRNGDLDLFEDNNLFEQHD
ncbi:MAG: hypothetical protein AB9882_02540 [Ignavibacteriaceae bacterium]